MLYLADKKAKLFKGDYKPVGLYLGNKKVTGYEYAEQTGEILSFEGTYNDTASVVINGKSEQVQTEQGKNLFDITKVNNLALSTTIVLGSTYRGYYCPCKPNTLYSVRRVSPTTNRLALCFTEDVPAHGVPYHNVSSDFGLDRYGLDVTIQATSGPNSKYVFIYFSNSSDTVPDTMLCEGEISEYEPFVPDSPSPAYPSPIKSIGDDGGFDLVSVGNSEQTQTIHLPYTLRSLPDGTRDYIEIDNVAKTAKLVQAVKRFILSPNENWAISSQDDNRTRFYFYRDLGVLGNVYNSQRCTHFQPFTDYSDMSERVRDGILFETSFFNNLVVSNNIASNVSELKTWLANNSVEINFKTTPTVTDLDYDEIKSYYPYTQFYTTGSEIFPDLDVTVRVAR